MNKVLFSFLLVFSAARVLAETNIHPVSKDIGQHGLAAVETRLSNQTTRTPSEQFALGGVRFLRAIETSLQTRWRHGITAEASDLPILRLGIPPNPSPQPFRPQQISHLFQQAVSGMAAVEGELASISDTADVALTIDLGDLWFDINMNGTRDSLTEDLMGFVPQPDVEAPVSMLIDFDLADVAWLRACCPSEPAGFREVRSTATTGNSAHKPYVITNFLAVITYEKFE